jgi:hypothetical protein
MPDRLGDRPKLRRKLVRRLRRMEPSDARLDVIEQGRLTPVSDHGAWRWVPIAAAGLIGLQLIVGVADAIDGEPAGSACAAHGDCESGFCLVHLRPEARYCSKACRGDGDCGPELTCGDAAALPHVQRGIGAAGPLAAGPVCVQ